MARAQTAGSSWRNYFTCVNMFGAAICLFIPLTCEPRAAAGLAHPLDWPRVDCANKLKEPMVDTNTLYRSRQVLKKCWIHLKIIGVSRAT